jgi:hypothetical protein
MDGLEKVLHLLKLYAKLCVYIYFSEENVCIFQSIL